MPQTASPASAAAPFRQDGNACHVAGDWSVLALAEAGEVERRRSALARAVQDGVRPGAKSCPNGCAGRPASKTFSTRWP
ncbi:hypothetical protein G6F50_017643 [Rhizopus delemar]|uniref:Uncharacterized protein n=1 Tax=Rhizopus delemar TaxID=936053 RepID=A0A9P6XQ20_9FUNG|nr:hypothetical protein G6F50_017643 [Rhizopus delemar]